MAIGTLTVEVSGPIETAFIEGGVGSAGDPPGSEPELVDTLIPGRAHGGGEAQGVEHLTKTLAAIAKRLEQFREKMVAEHRGAIAKLSVEIARKVLARQVSDKDYEIESIISEALNCAPSRQDVVVHLNPMDMEEFQKAGLAEKKFGGVKFTADSNVGPAECIVETPRGVIESMIEGHLEQVGRVLSDAV